MTYCNFIQINYVYIKKFDKEILNLPKVLLIVMYFESSFSLVDVSYQFKTSKTACGFSFCSNFVIFEFFNNIDQVSGKPYINKYIT